MFCIYIIFILLIILVLTYLIQVPKPKTYREYLKFITKVLPILFVTWVFIEIGYQVYLRSNWVSNGNYNWKNYVIKRNTRRLLNIQHYFKGYSKKFFSISYNPNNGDLKTLPKKVQKSILGLKNDLLNGMDIFNQREHFSLNFRRLNKNKNNYIIYIDAGAIFRSNFKGYNFNIIITSNDSSFSSRLGGFEKTMLKDVYINNDFNEKYRKKTFILKYNCNSYDLLILKLFRPLM